MQACKALCLHPSGMSFDAVFPVRLMCREAFFERGFYAIDIKTFETESMAVKVTLYSARDGNQPNAFVPMLKGVVFVALVVEHYDDAEFTSYVDPDYDAVMTKTQLLDTVAAHVRYVQFDDAFAKACGKRDIRAYYAGRKAECDAELERYKAAKWLDMSSVLERASRCVDSRLTWRLPDLSA